MAEAVRRRERGMQRRLSILETRSSSGETSRILVDEPFDEIDVAERHRREYVMPRTALEQQFDHRRVAFARRPADDLAFVRVAGTVHVGAGVEEQPHTLDVSICRREVERSGIVAG